jgi:acetoin utilization protein AcuC
MKTAFIYSDEFEKFTYSPSHPLKPIRFKLTYELAKAYGLFHVPNARLVQAVPCTEADIATVHSIEYIEAVRHGAALFPEWDLVSYGLGTEANPIFPQVYEKSLLAVGASLQAAKLVESKEVEIAFNIVGGQHHAFRNRASGFCYFNDVAVVIRYLLDKEYRVAYINIDAHHSDGVQEIFYRTNQVLKISIHESGVYLFPGTGFEREIGVGEGKGYSVNIPLPPYSDDDIFWYVFHEVVPPLVEYFQPDVLVTQLGVDPFYTDPLATLNLTTNGFCRVIEELKRLSPGKWVVLGGGGYDVLNVSRAWTLAWAIMNNAELPDTLPAPYRTLIRNLGPHNGNLRDEPYQTDEATKCRIWREVEKTLTYIKNNQFQIICGNQECKF